MKQIVYVSVAAPGLSRDGIDAILAVSRRNNAANGVTGLLCLLDASFLQILEGPAQAVDATYRRILRDGRHGGVLALLEHAIEQRDFAGWRMGFRDLDPDDPGSVDAFRLTAQAMTAALPGEGSGKLLTIARSFYRINARFDPGVAHWS